MNENLYLQHHGILGQKWGVRRYQNPDGTLTSAGRRRYQTGDSSDVNDISTRKGVQRRLNDIDKAVAYNTKDQYDSKEKESIYKKRAKKAKAKLEKNNRLYKEQARKEQEHYKNIQKGAAEVDSLIKKMESKGFNVKTKLEVYKVTRVNDFFDRYVLGDKHKVTKPLNVRESINDSRIKYNTKKVNAIQKDIDSFGRIKDGYVTKRGKTIMSKEDAKDAIKGLKTIQNKYKKRIKELEK